MVLLGIAVAFSPLGAGLCLLIYRWLRLRFFRRVYDRGGAADVAVIAGAMKWELFYRVGAARRTPVRAPCWTVRPRRKKRHTMGGPDRSGRGSGG